MLPVDQVSQVIIHSTAPAFLLGAVAAFVAVLITRMNRAVDRAMLLAELDDNAANVGLKSDIPVLKRRAALLNSAIFWAVLSAIAVCILVMLAFISALLGFRHEPGVALLFIVSLVMFMLSLVFLAREVRVALGELGHYK
jgi:magnesium-transporting ATPase (P-type)